MQPTENRSQPRLLLVLVVGLWTAVQSISAATTQMAVPELYQIACAACHGANGELPADSPRLKDFKRPPAAFTDPLFNSREPAQDWFLVVKHGGPALGLSSQMPSYQEAFPDAEIERLVGYVKTLAGPLRYPPGELNFFKPLRTIKAFPEDELVLKTRFQDEDGTHAWKNAVEFEKRIGREHQLELELIQEVEDGDGTLPEMEVGWKWAFCYSLERESLLSAGAKLAIPFRSEGQFEAIPYTAWAKGLSEHFTLQASLRSHLPFETFEDGDVELAGIVHWLTTAWPRGVFPAMEFTATVPFEQGDDDAVQFTLVPQLHVGLSKGGHVRLNAGVEVPLTRRTYDYRVHLALVWDWADGWFWERW